MFRVDGFISDPSGGGGSSGFSGVSSPFADISGATSSNVYVAEKSEVLDSSASEVTEVIQVDVATIVTSVTVTAHKLPDPSVIGLELFGDAIFQAPALTNVSFNLKLEAEKAALKLYLAHHPDVQAQILATVNALTNGALTSAQVSALETQLINSISSQAQLDALSSINASTSPIVLNSTQFSAVQSLVNSLPSNSTDAAGQAAFNSAVSQGKIVVRN